MSTIGELSDFGVADLIDALTRRGRTGRLTIRSAGQEIHLHFERGRLVLISSSDITVRLGRMMVRQGLLDTPRLLEALHLQAESGNVKPLGAIVIEKGWVTPADVARCLEEQSIEALARVITDPPGIFVFEASVTSSSRTETSPLNAAALVNASLERVEALKTLQDQLPTRGTELRLMTKAGDQILVYDDLGPPESMVVSVLRMGAKTLAEIEMQVALDELTLGVAVLGLMERRIVVAAGPSKRPATRSAVRAV